MVFAEIIKLKQHNKIVSYFYSRSKKITNKQAQ